MSDPSQYTVGWICALPLELTAARQFLDREHESANHVATNDTNTYTLGEMAGHNIVIAVLPEYGTNAAASAAANMLNSFTNVRLGLMVGIGGGAPSRKNDIRLGDIVVSEPTNGIGGVYQYDFGKTIQGREFQQTGHLNQPPPAVLTALKKLKSDYENEGHNIKETIETILKKKPKLGKKYGRPGQHHDRLYRSNVQHPHDDDGTCEELCGTEPSNITERHQREDYEDDPAVHYGIIASANQVMKDASLRDDLAKKKGILCFEMEAAGLMNQFPCLVVRGVCDYSDSHKSKEWQGFAAMTAAAYTKDVLATIRPGGLESENRLLDVLDGLSDKLTTIQADTRHLRTGLEESQQQQTTREIRTWLSPSDPSINLEKALEQRHHGTCQWLLKSDIYRSWRTTPKSFVWLYGLSGCGKTVLASTIIHELQSERSDSLFAFFYFDINGGGKRDLSQMLRSLVFQLSLEHPVAQEVLHALYVECKQGTKNPTLRQLAGTFESVLRQLKQVTIVVDALDECDSPSDVALWIEEFRRGHHGNVQLLVTSQNHGVLGAAIDAWPQRDQIRAIQIDNINRDIGDYVHARLFEGKEFQKWSSHSGLREQVEEKVLNQANGMFRLAACQLDDLKNCIDRPRLMAAIRDLPKTLQGIYSRILIRLIDNPCYREVLILLRFLIWSREAPSFGEMIDAITVRPDESPTFKKENRLFDLLEVTSQCSSLVTIIGASGGRGQEIHLAHSSVREYLVSQHLVPPFDRLLTGAFARASFAKTCVGYLIDLPDPCSGTLHEFREEYPFVAPASYWMKHATIAEADETLVRLILELYQSNHTFIESFGSSKGTEYAGAYLGWESLKVMRYNYPLNHACYWGLEAVAVELVDHGADVNTRNYYDNPLHAASYNGHENIVTILLARGADINGPKGKRCWVPLIAASYSMHVQIVKILLQSGADVFARNSAGKTAITILEPRRGTEVLQILLDHGTKVDHPRKASVYGEALRIAAKSLQSRNIQLLLDHGAHDINCTALQEAARHGDSAIALQLLQTGDYAHTCLTGALSLAIWSGSASTVDMLLRYGANPNGCKHGTNKEVTPHRIGTDPLLTALQIGHLHHDNWAVQLLVSKGARFDAHTPTRDFLDLLRDASKLGRVETVDFLLGAAVDVGVSLLQISLVL